MCGRPEVSVSFPQAESGQGVGAGGGAVLQTQECTHVSEQLLAVWAGRPLPGCCLNGAVAASTQLFPYAHTAPAAARRALLAS